MHPEGGQQLTQHMGEITGFEAIPSGLGVAMHGIAQPQSRVTTGGHRFNQTRQLILNPRMTEAMDQDQAARCALRVEQGQQTQHIVSRQPRPQFDPDRIGNATTVFDMRTVGLGRAHADPRHVTSQVVVIGTNGMGQGSLVFHDQRFV